MGMRPWFVTVAFLLMASILFSIPGSDGALAADPGVTTTGLVDTRTGEWHLRGPDGWTTSFYFGDPNDYPMMGDWDCDGIDTPGLYRQADGFVYLRNTNSQGVADIRFFFGDPGDLPLPGDFDGDGCDTVSIYRPSEGRVYVINELGAHDGGLGAADLAYYFGNPGDQPFVGDFDGNGIDTVGLHRSSTGFVYFRNTNTQGVADASFYFGDPGDLFVAGDWTGDGVETPGVYRPGSRTFYFRHTNSAGVADAVAVIGSPYWVPVAGRFGLPDVPISARTWSSWVVDGLGDVGRFNDIAIASMGFPIISYGTPHGLAWHELRIATCHDLACASVSTTPAWGAMYESTSIGMPSVAANDVPGVGMVSFYDPDTAGLRVMSGTGPYGSKDPWVVLSEGVGTSFGKYSEIGLAPSAVVTVVASGSHVADTLIWPPHPRPPVGEAMRGPDLDQWYRDNPRPPWQRQTVADLNEHSRPSLAIGSDGLARILVPGEPVGSAYPLRLLTCTDESCTYALITRVTIHEEIASELDLVQHGYSARASAHTSITVGVDGHATAAVTWVRGPGLTLVTCLDETCTSRSTTIVDSSPGAGRFVDLDLTPDGLPIMAYTDAAGAVKVAQCLDRMCTSVGIATIATPGPGTEVSLAIDFTGTPIVAYYDAGAMDLVVSRLR
jgi:hypothetical protein